MWAMYDWVMSYINWVMTHMNNSLIHVCQRKTKCAQRQTARKEKMRARQSAADTHGWFYGVAMISRLLKNIGLFRRIQYSLFHRALLQKYFMFLRKPTNRSHPRSSTCVMCHGRTLSRAHFVFACIHASHVRMSQVIYECVGYYMNESCPIRISHIYLSPL